LQIADLQKIEYSEPACSQQLDQVEDGRDFSYGSPVENPFEPGKTAGRIFALVPGSLGTSGVKVSSRFKLNQWLSSKPRAWIMALEYQGFDGDRASHVFEVAFEPADLLGKSEHFTPGRQR